ncbi:MAG: choice-of-anchor D domain-containing protein [Verrucomicrobiaceae bacterium]|nr:choice-of-anchor D domain-containing protein [Verrucomicrobiaceae bacterium]
MKHLISFFLRRCAVAGIVVAAVLSPLAAAPVPMAYVKAPNLDNTDAFGFAVAISGNTMVITAPKEDGSGPGVNPPDDDLLADAGAAYVYVRNMSGVWTFQAYLKASNPGAGDWFGSSVAISGDTIVVGAHLEDGGGTGVNPTPDEASADAGAAYVFTRSGGTWVQQACLKASNTGAGDMFGLAVAISGDTIAIGAKGEDGSGGAVNAPSDDLLADAGAAYVFTRSGGAWSQQAYLKPANRGILDNFGTAVAISEDTVVVGAPNEGGSGTGVNPASNESAIGAGAAYVFTRSGGAWSQQAYLKASNTGAGDAFGTTVTVFGEMVVAGAPNEDSSVTSGPPDELATSAGAVYAFLRSGSVWSAHATLKSPSPGANDLFGNSLSLSGSVLVIGTPGEDGSGTGVNPAVDEAASGAGAAFVFRHTGLVWQDGHYLKASQVSLFDGFGGSVAASGDTVIVGAQAEDGSGTGVNPPANELASDAGAAFVFSGIDVPEITVAAGATEIPSGGLHDTGDVAMGTQVVIPLTITNEGTVPLTITGSPLIKVSGPHAAVFTVLAPIYSSIPAYHLVSPAPATDSLLVRFTASTPGVKNALLTIYSNDSNENVHTIQLRANVVPPDVEVSSQGLPILDGGSKQIDPAAVGSHSDLIFDIANQGGATLFFTGTPVVSLSGPNADQFSIVQQPAVTSLDAGGATSFTVRFSPTGGGLKNALLTIASNDPDEAGYHIGIFSEAPPPAMQITQAAQPVGTSFDFGGVLTASITDRTFVIKNTGGLTLQLTGTPLLGISGAGAAAYSVVTPPAASIAPGVSTSFLLRFAPTSGGAKTAALVLPSNADGDGPRTIELHGTSLSFTADTDGDGLNDGSELQLAVLGFDWNTNQPALVSALFANANPAGLYTLPQIQTLNAGTPLLAKNPATGEFTLTLGLEKSTDLTTFTALPMTAPQCVINTQGRLEFTFTVPGNAAFFRVLAQ